MEFDEQLPRSCRNSGRLRLVDWKRGGESVVLPETEENLRDQQVGLLERNLKAPWQLKK